MDSDHSYESILLVKNEVFVYKIPPLGTSRGYKAADWKLDSPDFVVRLKLVSRNEKLDIKLEDKATGEPFAKCPVDKYPGQAVEAVRDSSRYFVLRIADDSGKSAFIGIGFGDRGDSFDLNVALQDFFKNLAKDEKLNQEILNEADKPRIDLSFKEGQTITINLSKLGATNAAGSNRDKSNKTPPAGFCLPPPPPAGARLAPQCKISKEAIAHSQQHSTTVTQSAKSTRSSASNAVDNLLCENMSCSTTASSRLRKDFIRLAKDPIPHVQAAPNRSNILEWHFVIDGPPDSLYYGGFYHGKLIFPSDYPFKPPSIYMLTPNGRFKTNYRLCLSISDYHPDTWNPAWSVGTILTGLLSFMLESSATLGSVETSDNEKRRLARDSLEFNLKSTTFCALFPELTRKLKDTLANGQSIQTPANNDAMISVDSQASSRLLSNLLILGGLLALVAIGRYIFHSTIADL